MFSKLVILFIVVPIIELALLIEIGQNIGVWPTLTLVILTGIAGAWLARLQGFMVLRTLQTELSQGILPAESILDGFLVLAGALLLLTPGILTDALGFALLIPLSRNVIKQYLKKWLKSKIDAGDFNSQYYIR